MSRLLDNVENKFFKNKWRITLAVRSIVDVLNSNNELLSVSAIEKILKSKAQTIDTSTVYRVLDKLKKTKLIHEFEGQWKQCSCPENQSDEHHFLICTKCKNVEEIFLDYKYAIAEQLLQEKKFTLTRVHLGFLGLCRNCL